MKFCEIDDPVSTKKDNNERVVEKRIQPSFKLGPNSCLQSHQITLKDPATFFLGKSLSPFLSEGLQPQGQCF